MRCNYYDQSIHEGTQPIRVLIPQIIGSFEHITRLLQPIYDKKLTLKIEYGEEPIIGTCLARINPASGAVSISETFLSYLWCYCYCIRINSTLDMLVCDWLGTLKYASRIIKVFTPWDKEELPNPELCPQFMHSEVRDTNTLFHFACFYILLHEIGHAVNGHSSPSLENELEADRFAARALLAYKLQSAVGDEAESFERSKLCGAICAIFSLSGLTKYFASSSRVHPHVDQRIRAFMETVNPPDNHMVYGLATSGILFVHQGRLDLDNAMQNSNEDERDHFDSVFELSASENSDTQKSRRDRLFALLDGFERARNSR